MHLFLDYLHINIHILLFTLCYLRLVNQKYLSFENSLPYLKNGKRYNNSIDIVC